MRLKRVMDQPAGPHAVLEVLADLVRNGLGPISPSPSCYHSLLDTAWLAELAATGIMALLGFVIVGVSPRQLGRVHSAGVVAVHRSDHPLPVLGPGPDSRLAGGTWAPPWPPGGPGRDEEASFSEEEFRELVDRAAQSDMIEDNEAELIHSVFDFGDTLVRSVMVPRTDIVSIDAGSGLDRAMALFLRSGYSRIPVIGENTDQIPAFSTSRMLLRRCIAANPDCSRTTSILSPGMFGTSRIQARERPLEGTAEGIHPRSHRYR